MNKALAILGIILFLVGAIDGAYNWVGSATTSYISSTTHTSVPNFWSSYFLLDFVLVIIGIALLVISVFT